MKAQLTLSRNKEQVMDWAVIKVMVGSWWMAE